MKVGLCTYEEEDRHAAVEVFANRDRLRGEAGRDGGSDQGSRSQVTG